MKRQTILATVFAVIFAASSFACSQGSDPGSLVSEPENEQTGLNAAANANRFIIQCPLDIYESGESATGISFEIIGLCPKDETGRIELIPKIEKALNLEYSDFTVINQAYTTTSLKDYFSFDPAQNKFFVSQESVQKMWDSLEKGEYEFTANPVSDDFDFSATFSFNFEIK